MLDCQNYQIWDDLSLYFLFKMLRKYMIYYAKSKTLNVYCTYN